MSQPKPKPCCQSARTWLANRNGRRALGVFTGSTSRVFSAYVHLVEVWLVTQSEQSEAAIRATVAMMQPSEWRLAAEAIASVGDWGHIEQLWERVKPIGAPGFAYHASTDQVLEVGSRGCPCPSRELDGWPGPKSSHELQDKKCPNCPHGRHHGHCPGPHA